jgi:hypothetical protein
MHQHIRRLDVFVDQAFCVDVAECGRNLDGQVEKLRHLQWPAEKACQRLTAAIFEQEHGALIAAQKRKRPNCPRGIKLSPEGVFVLKSPERRRRAGFSDGRHHEDARVVCIVPARPVKGTISLL